MRIFGNTVFRVYDPFGQITAEWGATYPVRYTYDTQGRRTSLSTTRDGTTWDTTAWVYDPVTGNCISKTYADGSTVSYTYTPDNLPLRTTYASHKWKEKVYDAQRRLCGVVYSSSDMDYELQLDVYGNATNVQDAAENTWRHVFGLNSILLGEEYVSMGEVQFSASAVTNSLSRIVDPFDRPAGFAFSVNGTAKCGIGYDYDCDGHVAHFVATNSAGRSFTVVYTNVAGYCCGYTLTTPSGDTIRRAVARDVPGKAVYVVDDLHPVFGPGRPAHALSFFDAHAGDPALERAEQQRAVLYEIESRPVDVFHRVEEDRRDVCHDGNGVARDLRELLRLFYHEFVICHFLNSVHYLGSVLSVTACPGSPDPGISTAVPLI